MRIVAQTSLPVGGPDSLIKSEEAVLLNGGNTNAAQLTVVLASGSVVLTPHWWSQVASSWIPASGGYQLSVNAAVQPAVSSIFTRASEAQWWALLKTGTGVISSCDLEAVTASEAGGVTTVTASSPLASSGGTAPSISLSTPVPVAKGGTGSDLSNAAVNRVLAGPASGGAGPLALRALVAADLPTIPTGGRKLLYKGDVTEVPVVLDAVAPGSVVQIAWSRDRGTLGPGALTQGGIQTLWVLADGSADYGGAPPSLQYHWSCIGGTISLWLDTLNTTARVAVELLPELA